MQCIAFYLSKGQRLDDLINATHAEKLLYFEGISKFYEFERDKLKALGAGEK